MERVSQGSDSLNLPVVLAFVVMVIAVLLVMPLRSVEAGTVFMPPEPVSKVSAELRAQQEFPDSKFGQPPSRVSPRDSYAARENMGDPDGASEVSDSSGGRFPATSDSVTTRSAAAIPEIEKSAMRRKGVQEVAIIAGDLGFFPKTFFVSRDVPVRLFVTGSSKQALCIMMDSFQVRKQIRSQKIEEITFTPNQPGTYRFYCPVNGMEGSMVVKELVSAQ